MDEEFVSELGATSLPNYETLIQFLPNHWPIKGHEDEWTFRKLQIPEAMRAWGEPGNLSLKEYIPRTQAYVARLFQIALERARRQKYNRFGGILHFHAIDIWPSVTMAAIDFHRVPTAVYHQVRRSFAIVAPSIEFDRGDWKSGETVTFPLWAINDDWSERKGLKLRWRIAGESGGPAIASGEFAADLEADSSRRLGEGRWTAGAPGRYRIDAELVDAAGNVVSENLVSFDVRP
jgi:beta-mannosidase